MQAKIRAFTESQGLPTEFAAELERFVRTLSDERMVRVSARHAFATEHVDPFIGFRGIFEPGAEQD